MSDLISRSEVWKAFISRVDSICDLEDVRETLDSIPTIEERKEGQCVSCKHQGDEYWCRNAYTKSDGNCSIYEPVKDEEE